MLNEKKIRKTGSVNIPVAMRREMGIQPNDAVSVNMVEEGILIKPLAPRCLICSEQIGLVKLEGRYICKACAGKVLTMTEEV